MINNLNKEESGDNKMEVWKNLTNKTFNLKICFLKLNQNKKQLNVEKQKKKEWHWK